MSDAFMKLMIKINENFHNYFFNTNDDDDPDFRRLRQDLGNQSEFLFNSFDGAIALAQVLGDKDMELRICAAQAWVLEQMSCSLYKKRLKQLETVSLERIYSRSRSSQAKRLIRSHMGWDEFIRF